MRSRQRFGFIRVESALASLFFVLAGGCATAPRLSPAEAAVRIRGEVSEGMTKAEVRRVVGEPERRELTSLPWGDVSRKRESGSNRSGECWLWGIDRRNPDAFVCFGGLDPTVSHKGP